MTKRYGLGLDIGTSKISAVLVDACERRVCHAVSRNNDALYAGLPDGWHEQSPQRIRCIAAEAVHELLLQEPQAVKSIVGVGVTGQMHGVLLTDCSLTLQTPLITWRDKRTAGDFLAKIQTTVDGEHPTRTGCALNCGYGGVTLSWLMQNGDPTLAALAQRGKLRALTIADYLAAVLTGVYATAASHAASWGLFNLITKAWDTPLLQSLQIPEAILVEVRDDRPLLGVCTTAAAEEFGLLAGTPVWLALGDNQASVYAAADGDANCMVLNLGTGGQISFPVECVAWASGRETRPLAGGGLMKVGSSLCGGWSYSYLCSLFQRVCYEIGGIAMSMDEVYAKMATIVNDKANCTLRVDSRFAGSRDGLFTGGAIRNITVTNLTPAELVLAFQESMVRELAELADICGTSSTSQIGRLVATGNAVRRNSILPSIIERIFGMPCMLSPHIEEAGAGAALWMLDSSNTHCVTANTPS